MRLQLVALGLKNTQAITIALLTFALYNGPSFFAAAQNSKTKNEERIFTLRVARPTDNLLEVVRFYRDGLGLEILTSFDRLGYKGEILGSKGSPYHFEFLHQRGRKVGKAPTQDNILAFYIPEAEWSSAVERMQRHGYEPVKPANLFWEKDGKTFEDVDGYRVVLIKTSSVSGFLRVARPTDNLPEVLRFYRDGLGLGVIGAIENHDGFDGVTLGPSRKILPYHLEFTHVRGETVGKAPTRENLLVFFIADRAEYKRAVERMKKHGYQPVKAENPWGNTKAKTFEDVDGYRVVLKNASWK